jgi:hypothetical protein
MASKLTPSQSNSSPSLSSCYVCQGNQLCLYVQQSYIQIQIFGFNIHQKPFIRKISTWLQRF